jgi:putative glutamine amidotransferase
MIKLGVSACFMYPDPNRAVFGHKTLTYLESDMGNFLSQQGVLPILLPNVPWPQLTQYLDEIDGLVFQGGADISPKSYKEEMIENGRWPGDFNRDQYELKLMQWGFDNKVPMLAICRGFQLMNVFFGGTLYQDLKLQTNTGVEHRNAELYDKIAHQVELTGGSLLKNFYPQEKVTVNSVHHQGVKQLGKDLIVDAICPEDKLVEAFHYKNLEKNYCVGVQWHPEFSHTLGSKVADPKPLLDHFLSAVKSHKEKK